MRNCFSCLILGLLSLYLQSNATIWASYFALQDEIAKHCENRTNAHCNGKCQMKKVEQTNPDAPLIQVHTPEVSEFLVKKTALPKPDASKNLPFANTQILKVVKGFSSEVFRPPTAA